MAFQIAGELHKSKFGSGSSGPCISMDGEQFLTPVQFEAACGRAASKDWRSSIKFGSSPLKTLIEREVLVPHSTRCGCSVCVDKVRCGFSMCVDKVKCECSMCMDQG